MKGGVKGSVVGEVGWKREEGTGADTGRRRLCDAR